MILRRDSIPVRTGKIQSTADNRILRSPLSERQVGYIAPSQDLFGEGPARQTLE